MDKTTNDPIAMTVNGSSPRASDHAIYILLDFPCLETKDEGPLLGVTPANLDKDGGLAIVHEQRRAQADQRPLFARSTLAIGDDLNPAVRVALGSPAEAINDTHGVPCLRLTDAGRSLLNGGQVPPPGRPPPGVSACSRRGLVLSIGPESRKRVAIAPDPATGDPAQGGIAFSITDLTLLTFPTGVGLAVLELRLEGERPSLGTLQEAVHILAHSGRARSVGWAAAPEPAVHFTPPELIATILQPAGCAPEPRSRIFTYVFACFETFPAEEKWAEHAAWRLSRHYTGSYRAGTDFASGSALTRPFADVTHAASIEGAATVALSESTFLGQSFRNRIETSYLPLAILAYHEQVQLLELAQHAASPVRHPDDIGEDWLRDLVERFLAFRLRYRLPVVSDLTMHNLFYDALRAGLRLDQLTRKITEDTTEAERSLRQAHSRKVERQSFRRERRWAPILALFAALLTFLTSMAAFKEIRSFMQPRFEITEWGAFVAAALLAVLSWYVTWRQHLEARQETRDRGREDRAHAELQRELEHEAAHVASELKSVSDRGAGVISVVRQAPAPDKG